MIDVEMMDEVQISSINQIANNRKVKKD